MLLRPDQRGMAGVEMILETERLLLRPMTLDDGEDLYDFARDPRVSDAAGWRRHVCLEDSLRVIRETPPAPYDFAFVDRGTGKVVGTGGLTGRHRDWLPGADDEIAYALHPGWWGRGLAVEAMEAVLKAGFGELGLDHVWCGYYEGNEGSRRVQEKRGCQPWGEPRWVEVPSLREERLEYFSLLYRADWERRMEERRYG